MPSKHRRNPLTVRLPDGERAWLREYAFATGRPVGAVINDAVRTLRQITACQVCAHAYGLTAVALTDGTCAYGHTQAQSDWYRQASEE